MRSDNIADRIVEQLNARRRTLGYNILDVGRGCKTISVSTVRKILTGITRNPKLGSIEEIAAALGFEASMVFRMVMLNGSVHECTIHECTCLREKKK